MSNGPRMPPLPTLRILNYQTRTPTAVRQAGCRASRIASILLLICAGIMTCLLAIEMVEALRALPGNTLVAWILNNKASEFPVLLTLSWAAVFAACAKPLLHANRFACHAVSAAALTLQLALVGVTFVFVAMTIVPLVQPATRWYYAFAIPTVLTLWAIGLLSDLNVLAQWIARYPDYETAIGFTPRMHR
jgi:hypothetical protein